MFSILRADSRFDYRIPALVTFRDSYLMMCDRRPRPAADFDWQGRGGAMAADLPNPNALMMSLSKEGRVWEPLTRVPGTPKVCGDAALSVTPAGLTLAYAASEEIGYFGSRYAGPRLEGWLAHGDSPEDFRHRKLDELYEEWHADGFFATSGHSENVDGLAAFPYVVKRGEECWISVVYTRGLDIVKISEPVISPSAEELDETAIFFDGEQIFLSCRLQKRGGRACFTSPDGEKFHWAGFLRSQDSGEELSDPACNACFIPSLTDHFGHPYFIHPHHATQRERGAILCAGNVIHSFGEGEFGYSDAAYSPERKNVLVVWERENGIVGEILSDFPSH